VTKAEIAESDPHLVVGQIETPITAFVKPREDQTFARVQRQRKTLLYFQEVASKTNMQAKKTKALLQPKKTSFQLTAR